MLRRQIPCHACILYSQADRYISDSDVGVRPVSSLQVMSSRWWPRRVKLLDSTSSKASTPRAPRAANHHQKLLRADKLSTRTRLSPTMQRLVLCRFICRAILSEPELIPRRGKIFMQRPMATINVAVVADLGNDARTLICHLVGGTDDQDLRILLLKG
jgi:hypothetical protein